MTIRITEDEDESGGYAFIDLGRPLASPLLSFRRQDTEPRHLGTEGWQPEVAWLAPLAVTERDGRAVARFGPTSSTASRSWSRSRSSRRTAPLSAWSRGRSYHPRRPVGASSPAFQHRLRR